MFGEFTTALEVIEGINLTGYEVIVTGATSGIGVETARALAKAGARVTITARDLNRGEEIAEEIRSSTGNQKIEVEELKLDSLKNVRAFVKRFLAKNRPLHILINNAGVMACPLSYTEDGFETQIGTNHFGHFVLTKGLLPALNEGFKTSGRYSRVVNVSSLAHINSDINYDDLNFKEREYVPFIAYGQSKTANILFSVELTRRYRDLGIVSNALMPGAIMTNLQRHMSKEEMEKRWKDEQGRVKFPFKSIEQGASTQVWAAVATELEGKGGLYLENCSISEPSEKSIEELYKDFRGVRPYALDTNNASKFWDFSEKLLLSS